MIKVNLMSGKRYFGDDWVHIDGNNKHMNNITLDNWPNNHIWLVYCSHGIAYFNMTEIINLLKVWFTKIVPGGTLRIATPNFDALVKTYRDLGIEKILGPLYGEMEMNGTKIYHKTTYTEKTLTQLLTDAGFINIRRYDHTKTEHPNTGNREDQFDDCSASYINGTLISLNMECNKP